MPILIKPIFIFKILIFSYLIFIIFIIYYKYKVIHICHVVSLCPIGLSDSSQCPVYLPFANQIQNKVKND